MEQLRQCLGFGVEPLRLASASASGLRARSSAWRAAECAASAQRIGFRLDDRGVGLLDRLREPLQIGASRGLAFDLRQLGLDRSHLVGGAGEPLAVLAY